MRDITSGACGCVRAQETNCIVSAMHLCESMCERTSERTSERACKCECECQIINSSELTGISEFGWRVRQFRFHVWGFSLSIVSFRFFTCIVLIRVLYELFFLFFFFAFMFVSHSFSYCPTMNLQKKADFFGSLTPLFFQCRDEKEHTTAAACVSTTNFSCFFHVKLLTALKIQNTHERFLISLPFIFDKDMQSHWADWFEWHAPHITTVHEYNTKKNRTHTHILCMHCSNVEAVLLDVWRDWFNVIRMVSLALHIFNLIFSSRSSRSASISNEKKTRKENQQVNEQMNKMNETMRTNKHAKQINGI